MTEKIKFVIDQQEKSLNNIIQEFSKQIIDILQKGESEFQKQYVALGN
jgi:hypothetical protein